jgi:hypothetical protein
MALNVFIGWSGRRSYLVAFELMVWLKEVIPTVETWMSVVLPPGTVQWFNELNKNLRQADFAVICVNPENWENPWISYEPGVVLGKTETETRVCPYLIDRNARRRDLPEPLKYFLAEMATKEGTYRLVKIINEAAGSPLSERKLRGVFSRRWRKLDKVITDAAPPPPPPPPPTPPEPADYMDDFMRVSRCIELHQDRLYGRFHDVIEKAVELLRAGEYEHEAIFRLATDEIMRSKERFTIDHSLLVGSVCEFFETYYTDEELHRSITKMEAALKLNTKPDEPRSIEELEPLRKEWKAYMKTAVAEVFSQYHKVLLGKLNYYLRQR